MNRISLDAAALSLRGDFAHTPDYGCVTYTENPPELHLYLLGDGDGLKIPESWQGYPVRVHRNSYGGKGKKP